MTAALIQAFFEGYAQAFSDRDIDRICSLWSYPAFMVFEGRQVSLDATAFRDNTHCLCDFYDRQGVATAAKDVVGLARLTAHTATVHTRDRLYDADGSQVATWEHVYLLSTTAGGLKVAAAMPDGEIAAWRERGTPLGG